jgi:hypothetical protein
MSEDEEQEAVDKGLAEALEDKEKPEPSKTNIILGGSIVKLFQFITNVFVLQYVFGTLELAFGFAYPVTFVQASIAYLSYEALSFDSKASSCGTWMMNTETEVSSLFVAVVCAKPLFLYALFALLRQVL